MLQVLHYLHRRNAVELLAATIDVCMAKMEGKQCREELVGDERCTSPPKNYYQCYH
jgi:hypothetical protein